MPPFTQYTQAAPACTCYGRGYTTHTGDFAACDCEAGAAWTAARPVAVVAPSLVAPSIEAPALAPALAPAAVAIPAGKVRRSTSVPGLTYETDVRGGVVYLTFRCGPAFEVIGVAAGQVVAVDCSDRYGMPYVAAVACRDFTQALAAKLARKAVAA
jgi:hypothetical protein